MIFEGKSVHFWLHSKLLEHKPSGDSCNREILSYIPRRILQEDPELKKRYPVVYALAPWTSGAASFFHRQPFKKSLPDRVDQILSDPDVAPFVLVCPDYCTWFGGTQFIDSSFFGPHARSIVEELFPLCESLLPILEGPSHRAVMGRSSGGFGALRLALDYPGSIAAVAAHSADSAFDLLFKSDLTTLCDKTRTYSGDIEQYVSKIKKLEKVLPGDVHAMMLLGSAGFYSANPRSPWGFDLPIDLHSGEIDHLVWNRWLDHDPITKIKTAGENLKKLKYLYIECGLSDQFRLLYGARQMHSSLKSKQITHDYEEFADNHSGTDYRFNVSIPRILKHIS